MKSGTSKLDDFLKEHEELRARAKAGDPAAQIEIAGKIFAAVKKGEISARDGNPDAFRWVRTAEINPVLTDEQRVQLAEILLKDDKGNETNPSLATFRKAKRLLDHAYNHGTVITRGRAAEMLGDAYDGKLFSWHKWTKRTFDGKQFSTQLEWTWTKRTLRDIPRSLVWFRRAAHCGNVWGAIKLFRHYYLGIGVLANANKARYWQERAEEIISGEQSQYAELARLQMKDIEHGSRFTTQKQFELAKEELTKAESEDSVSTALRNLETYANEGYAPAMELWCAEILNTKLKGSFTIAKVFLHEAVRQGHPAALATAGRWLLKGGGGVRQNIQLAQYYLNRSAMMGDAEALALLCGCTLVGWGRHKQPMKARELWKQAEKQAAKQNNNGRCLYELFFLKQGLDQSDSISLLRAAAEAGHVGACYEIGLRYRRGLGVRKDLDEALFWLQKAAFRRHPSAQYEVSRCHGKKGEAIPWLEKALCAGITLAGIELGRWRIKGKVHCLMPNWQEAERLFRRFCPLHPRMGYQNDIIKHFLAKPMAKRSERDHRFLERARDYLRKNDPGQAAILFASENPDFAAECHRLSQNILEGDAIGQQAKELGGILSQAESHWQSDNEELRHRAGETFIKWARYLSSPAGRKFQRKHYLHPTTEETEEMVSRCYWRATQMLLRESDLSNLPLDTKKTIDDWVRCALKPYCRPYRYRPHDSTNSMIGNDVPDFIREAAFFCCRNTKAMDEIGLSLQTIGKGCQVAVGFGDKKALIWLIENIRKATFPIIMGGDLKIQTASYLRMGVDAKIPMALRMEADRIASDHPILESNTENRVAELLREAADLGDAEAQCRQGEMCLHEKKPQAKEWFLKAANQEHERAIMHLGQLLSEESPGEAIDWLQKLAENPEADIGLRTIAKSELGKLYLGRQEMAIAARYLRTAAQNNNRTAIKLLALEPGLRGVLSDEEIRVNCLSLLKEEDDDGSIGKDIRCQVLTRLGQVEKDKSKSAVWFRQAAEAGDGPGAYEWARCLLFGDGCPQNFQEAGKWFREARKRCEGSGNPELAGHARSWLLFLLAMNDKGLDSIPPEQRKERRREVGLGTTDTGDERKDLCSP